MATAAPLPIAADDVAELRRWVRSTKLPAVLVQRARILLLAAEGTANTDIAGRVGVSRPTVIACRRRYVRRGLAGLPDRPRPGRPQTVRRIRRSEILQVTLTPPPAGLGITHWSTRLVARELGVSHDTVARIWREHGIQPWRVETFKFSTDPELVAKVRDVVGLYLHPPERAVVLCVDEKSQIQALDRTQPLRRVWPGRPEQRTHDYVRHGTTTLFAALEVATGRVTNQCQPRHRHQEFLAFLKQVARAYPRRQLHVICDNYATHRHPAVGGWLAKHARVRLHFTPTSASWLNMVEVFFSIIDRQALRRGDFPSVDDLAAAIGRFCTTWNEHCQPFSWTKPADQLLAKLKRQGTSATEHGGSSLSCFDT
jgi:transposase